MANQARFRLYRLGTYAGLLLLLASCAGDPLASVGIEPMEFPNIESLEQRVGEQVRRAQEAVLVTARLGRRDSTGARLGELGRLYLLYGLTDAAREALRRAADADSLDPRWSYYLGQVYQVQGAHARAEAAYRVYNQAVPSTPGLVHEAEVLIDQGRDEEASGLLERALAIDSTTALAHYMLAQIHERSGAWAEAVAHYESVLRLQPGASLVNYALGTAYRRLGNEDRARQLIASRGEGRIVFQDVLIQEMEALRTGSQALAQEGYLLLESGHLDQAIRVLSQAVAENPDNGAAQLNLGSARLYAGDAAGSLAALEEALRINPRDGKAHYLLGVRAEALGDRAEAMSRYQAAADADASISDAFLGLARLYWQEQDCEQAIRNYEMLLRIEPGHPDHVLARIHRAMCHVRLGNHGQARRALEADAAGFPNEVELVGGLVRVLAASPDEASRDGVEAVGLAEALVDRVDRFDTRMTLAIAYAEAQRFDEAVASIDRAIADTPAALGVVLDYLRSLRGAFEAGQPLRQPWPDYLYGRL